MNEQTQLPLMDERYFSTREVADTFNVKVETVRGWTRSGRLRSIRVGRWTRIPESAIVELAQGKFG